MVVDKSGERVRKMFGEIAPGYDRMNHLLSMNIDRYWRWLTVRKLQPQPSSRILDVCTGTGDLALAFASRKLANCEVTGSDFCREMLEIGEKKRARREMANVAFLQADAQELPFPDHHFDIVTVAFGLRNVADTDRGLSEMTRVTKPGGQIAVLEFSTPRRQPIKSAYGFYFRHILPKVGQLLARNKSNAYNYLPESVGEFPSYEKLADRMAHAGMTSVRFYPLTFGVATLYVGVKKSVPITNESESTAPQEEVVSSH